MPMNPADDERLASCADADCPATADLDVSDYCDRHRLADEFQQLAASDD